jgi:hypothetical protein
MSFWITIIIRPRSKKARELAYDRECSFIIEEGRNALQVVKA